ncbi:MAG TPA: mismatch-specific DNA-glycosylase [Vicinamibacterales bacterium]|nr:mismatch-specific DNA-glycosylase [Vicinamibacterales bacterium]
MPPPWSSLRLRDRIRPGVRVLFVGINPGVRSAQVGHHFAGYSNRFWKLLSDARLVPEPIGCEDDGRLPEWGFGITNLVARPTPGISDLTADDYRRGRAALVRKIRRYQPEVVALVGVTLFRALFPDASRGATIACGPRPERLGGVPVFVLPNPSGRNANFSYDEMLQAFRKLKRHRART